MMPSLASIQMCHYHIHDAFAHELALGYFCTVVDVVVSAIFVSRAIANPPYVINK